MSCALVHAQIPARPRGRRHGRRRLQRVLLGEPDQKTYLDGVRTLLSATIAE